MNGQNEALGSLKLRIALKGVRVTCNSPEGCDGHTQVHSCEDLAVEEAAQLCL